MKTVAHDVQELKSRLKPEQVSTAAADIEAHSRDEGYPQRFPPDVVVYAESRDDIQAVVSYADVHGIPITPFSRGTSLEGNALCRYGGISLDLSRMNHVVEIRPQDFLAIVEPGMTYPELNRALSQYGLFFPIDPGAEASIGGMAATNASGTMAVRYGTMKENVLSLEVVTASGQWIHTGTRARKSSSGYNLTPLLVGSEGTLGIFTSVTVRLYGIASILAATVVFPSISQAVEAVVGVMTAGIPVARIELVDPETVRAVNRYKGTSLEVAPTLFLEFHGNEAGVREDAELTQAICAECGGSGFTFAANEQARNQLWEARHHAYYAIRAMYPGKSSWITDVDVPISSLPDAIANAQRMLQVEGIYGATLGHVGDGNFHVIMMVDAAAPHEVNRAEKVIDGIVSQALSVGGTATAEHGVGIRKQRYMEREHGDSLQWMRAIKQVFDPKHLLNPGKLVDPPDA